MLLVDALAAQIEEAVAEAGYPRDIRPRLATGSGSSCAADCTVTALREHLDLAGGQVGELVVPSARAFTSAVDRHDRFDAQPLQQRQRRRIRVRDDLRQPIMIAQIDEQHAAMIALAMHPAGQADGLADVGGAEVGASYALR